MTEKVNLLRNNNAEQEGREGRLTRRNEQRIMLEENVKNVRQFYNL